MLMSVVAACCCCSADGHSCCDDGVTCHITAALPRCVGFIMLHLASNKRNNVLVHDVQGSTRATIVATAAVRHRHSNRGLRLHATAHRAGDRGCMPWKLRALETTCRSDGLRVALVRLRRLHAALTVSGSLS